MVLLLTKFDLLERWQFTDVVFHTSLQAFIRRQKQTTDVPVDVTCMAKTAI